MYQLFKFFLPVCACLHLFCSDMENKVREHFFSPSIESLNISDWYNPTTEDYLLIQQYFREKLTRLVESPISSRPFPTDFLNTEFHGWLTYRMGRINLVQDGSEPPSFNVIHFNDNPNNKDKCIICYAGYPSRGGPRDYAQGIRYLIKALKKVGFDGHFIYRIGGWPNIQKGRLKYVDVPFSFKPFLFEEVRDLGYKKILWLDSACLPIRNLDPVFQVIEKMGLCFYSYGDRFGGREFNKGYKYLMPFLNISSDEEYVQVSSQYEQISSQIVGLDMTDARASHLLDEWIKAAESRIPFLQSDEPAFMFLVNHLKLLHGRLPLSFYVETPCNTGNFAYWQSNARAIIYHQYDFINPEYKVPEELLN